MKNKQYYIVTKDADMLAPSWLAARIDYKSVKFVYVLKDGIETLKGVKINGCTAKTGDTVCFDGKHLSVERR